MYSFFQGRMSASPRSQSGDTRSSRRANQDAGTNSRQSQVTVRLICGEPYFLCLPKDVAGQCVLSLPPDKPQPPTYRTLYSMSHPGYKAASSPLSSNSSHDSHPLNWENDCSFCSIAHLILGWHTSPPLLLFPLRWSLLILVHTFCPHL